jgi:exonuclease SbcD
MKILHTADWHLGKKLGGYSRHAEQILVLDEICGLADAHEVDLVLIAGDLFDGPNPSSESTELFYKTLRRLSNDGSRAVIAIAGNHDSPERIAAPEPLALACGIVLLGFPDTEVPYFETEKGIKVLQSSPGFLELSLPKTSFPVRLILTAFANEIRLKKYLGQEDSDGELKNLIEETWNFLAKKYCDPKGVNLLMTHLYFVPSIGEIEPESDDERSIAGLGGTQALPTTILPPEIQYVALGHIHKFWPVSMQPMPVIYPSSPLCYSLNESGQEKFVIILDIEPATPVNFQKIKLEQGKQVLRMTFDSVDKAVAWLAENQDAYVELTMVSNEYLNAEDSSRIYASHKWILDLIPQSKNSTISGLTQQAQTIDIQLDKSELFESFFIQKKGQEPSLELKKLFHEILNS